MSDDDLTAEQWRQELRLTVNRLVGILEEVEEHMAAGKLDAAALVLGVSTGKVAELNEAYTGLQKQLRAEGADPNRALGRG